MRGVSTGCNNAAAQDFRDNLVGSPELSTR